MATAAEGKYDLLLDVSGSMAGFKLQGEGWKGVAQPIYDQAHAKYIFGDKNHFQELKGMPLFAVKLGDKQTFLGEAVRDWVTDAKAGNIAVVVTDNVADTGKSQSAQSQQILERLVVETDSPFSHVGLFTLRLPFKGKVYNPVTNKSKRFTGDRALVVYVLGREGVKDEDFKRVRDALTGTMNGYDHHYFHVRPFQQEELSSQLGAIDIEARSDSSARVSLRDKHLEIRDYSFGEPLQLDFEANITTRSSFELKDIGLEAAITFDDAPQLSRENVFFADVSPRRTTLTPNKITGFKVKFNIGNNFGFFDLPFSKKLAYTIQDKQELKGNLEIKFQATRDSYQVNAPLLEKWGYDGPTGRLGEADAAVQGRIYNLKHIVQGLVLEKVPEQTLEIIPVTLEMRFPLGPILSLLFLALLVVGILYLLARGWRRQQDYLLEDDYGDTIPVSLGFGQVYRYFDKDMQNLFNLRYIGIGFLLNSRLKRIRGSRLLGAGEHFVLRNPETEEEMGWRLRRKRRETYGDDDDGLAFD